MSSALNLRPFVLAIMACLLLFLAACSGGGGASGGTASPPEVTEAPPPPGAAPDPTASAEPPVVTDSPTAEPEGPAEPGGSTSTPSPTDQEPKDAFLAELRQELAQLGDPWTAGVTPVSTASPEHLLGIAPAGMVAAPVEDASVATLPRSFSWRSNAGADWVTSVKDQGDKGACMAFAGASALETLRRLAVHDAGLLLDFSEWHLYYFAHDGARGEGAADVSAGMYPEAALEFLVHQGTVNESDCPYSQAPYHTVDDHGAATLRVTRWRQLRGRDNIRAALVQGPVVGTMVVYRDLFAYRGGVYSVSETARRQGIVGGHAVCVVGYDDNQQFWLCKNSWGSGWGEDGYFRLHYGECEMEDHYGAYAMDLDSAPPPSTLSWSSSADHVLQGGSVEQWVSGATPGGKVLLYWIPPGGGVQGPAELGSADRSGTIRHRWNTAGAAPGAYTSWVVDQASRRESNRTLMLWHRWPGRRLPPGSSRAVGWQSR